MSLSEASSAEIAAEMHKRGMALSFEISGINGVPHTYIIGVRRSHELLEPDEMDCSCCVCGSALVHRSHAPADASVVCPEHADELGARRTLA